MARSPRSRSTPSDPVEAAVDDAVVVTPAAEDARPADPAPPPEAATENPAAPPEPVTPPAVPRPAAGRPIAVALAAAFGGALGVAATLVLLPYGLRGIEPPLPDPTLHHRLTQLETRPIGVTAEALAPLETRLAALESATPPDIAALAARIEALDQGPSVDLSGIEARLADLESAPPPQAPDLGALEARVAALESGIRAEAEAAVTAAVESTLAETRAETAAREAALAADAARVERASALAALRAAAESGEPAAEALARLGDAAPADLAPMADGLVTQAALETTFAPAARQALAAMPLPESGGVMQRLGSFLRAQTGARSLAPRAGDDPDAILSRAEAALRARDLAGALAELDALPEPAAAALADWRQQAQTRHAALTALAALGE